MAMLSKSISLCGNQILHSFRLRSMKSCSSHFVSSTDPSPTCRFQQSIVSGDLHHSAVRDANLGHFHYSDLDSVHPNTYGVLSDSDGVLRDSYGASMYNHPPYDLTGNNMFHSSNQPPPYCQLPPDYREWEYADSNYISRNKSFRILSYNLLADYLANSHTWRLYRHIPPHILQWQWRKTCIITELGFWSSDLMCFQEVDKFHELEWELRIYGYNGIWKKRTGNSVDGCAIFWRNSRFNLLHEESIEFNKLGLRDNIAQICVLQMVDQSHKLVLCNTHVLYNPKRGDIKFAQIRILLQKVHTISKNWDNAPVILCGDFNCTPGSPIYNFIAHQKVDFTDLDWYNVSGQASAEIHPWINASIRDAETAIRLKRGISFRRIHRSELHTLNFNTGINPTNVPCSSSYTSSQVEKGSTSNSSNSVLLSNEGVKSSYTSSQVEKNSASNSSNSVLLSNQEVKSSNGEEHGSEEKEDVEKNCENCDNFLSELHGSDDGFAVSNSSEFESSIRTHDGVYRNLRKWTYAEMEIATGRKEDNSSMEHPLKLKSSYTEIRPVSGTRDLLGEPLATSYNRCFFGTVDYIWRSEGLQTAAVLSPIRKNAMIWTEGFPTPKWGSDHIALVSELTFIDQR